MRRKRQKEIKDNISGGKGRRRGQTQPKNRLTEPLTPKQARKMAGAKARAEYSPVIGQMKREIGASGQRQQDITSMYGQLGDQIGQAAQQTDASYAGANAAMQAQIEAAGRAAAEAQGKIASQNVDFAALTGADPSSFTQGAETQAAAANQRGIAGAALAAPIAQAGASQASYLRNTGINARREGIHQRGKERSRAQQIKQDLMRARKERSQTAQANFGDIRQQERDYLIQRSAFNLDKKEGQREAAEGAADRAYDRQQDAIGNRQEQERIGISRRNSRDDGGDDGMTPTQKRAARREQKSANIAARNLYNAAKKPPQTPQEWAAFTQLVAAEEGIDPVAAQKAVSRLRKRLGGQKPRPEDIPR